MFQMPPRENRFDVTDRAAARMEDEVATGGVARLGNALLSELFVHIPGYLWMLTYPRGLGCSMSVMLTWRGIDCIHIYMYYP
jgi:hypothetical protein